jgi:hypothetical protein
MGFLLFKSAPPVLCIIAAHLVGLSFCGSVLAQQSSGPVLLPTLRPDKLVPQGKLGAGAKKEVSGIVASRKQEDLYWTHGDSGNAPRIYPVHRNGKLYWGDRQTGGKGMLVDGATNLDWEDIATDASGHLIIGDIGNNDEDRREFVLYYIDEPPPQADRVKVKKKVSFRYPAPQQLARSRNDISHDAESLFTIGDTVYVLTKHETGRFTELYRLDRADPTIVNELTYVGRFDFRDPAVAADVSANDHQLVVATGKSLWLFDLVEGDNPFAGSVRWLPFKAKQVESVCFADDKSLLLADEENAALYHVPLEKLVRVR